MKSEPFNPYPAYKASATEWLERIPSHWEKWKLGHAFKVVGSGTTPPTHEPGFYDGDIPWVTTSELRETVITATEKCVSLKAIKASPTLRTYPAGSLAFAMYGATIGRVGILGVPATVNQACCVFSNPVAAYTKFIFYWLLARRPVLIALSSGGGQPNLNQAELRSIRAELPPVEEQRAIASFLDRETARLDGLVAQKEKLLALLEEKRASLITHAVSHGLNPHAPTKPSGIPWLGDIPEHWELKNLGFLLTRITYGFTNPMPTSEEGPYLLTANDIGEGVIKFETARRTTPEAFRQLLTDKSRPRNGDLLLTKDGTLGRLAIVGEDQPCCINQSVALLRVSENTVSKQFLSTALRASAYQERMAFEAGGTTIKHLYITRLTKMPIALPPKAEQEQIAQFADAATGRILRLEEAIKASIAKYQERRTALISAAVTGQIDVRNWIPAAA